MIDSLFVPFASEIGAYDGRLGYNPREFLGGDRHKSVANRLELGDYEIYPSTWNSQLND